MYIRGTHTRRRNLKFNFAFFPRLSLFAAREYRSCLAEENELRVCSQFEEDSARLSSSFYFIIPDVWLISHTVLLPVG